MAFNILYPEKGTQSNHLYSIAVYVDSFAKKLGVKSLQTDPGALSSVAQSIIKPDFPHIDGLEKASPFKKAANFFVWFVAAKPIIQELPIEIIGRDLNSIPNHQNVIFAYHMAVDALHKATIHRDDGSEIVLKNRIQVSLHFFNDFVEAFSAAVPYQHFKIVSLLFEQLAYKSNRRASYEEIV